MSRRYRFGKGALYICAGLASPTLLADHPLMAIIQTNLLIGWGGFNLGRAYLRTGEQPS